MRNEAKESKVIDVDERLAVTCHRLDTSGNLCHDSAMTNSCGAHDFAGILVHIPGRLGERMDQPTRSCAHRATEDNG